LTSPPINLCKEGIKWYNIIIKILELPKISINFLFLLSLLNSKSKITLNFKSILDSIIHLTDSWEGVHSFNRVIKIIVIMFNAQFLHNTLINIVKLKIFNLLTNNQKMILINRMKYLKIIGKCKFILNFKSILDSIIHLTDSWEGVHNFNRVIKIIVIMFNAQFPHNTLINILKLKIVNHHKNNQKMILINIQLFTNNNLIMANNKMTRTDLISL